MLQYVTAELLSLLEQQNIEKGEVFLGSGLTESDLTSVSMLSAIQSDQLSSQALKLSSDIALGLKLGVKLNMLSLGILGYALMSCATVEKALYLLRRYNQAVAPSMTIDIVTHGSSASLVGSGSHLPTNLERFYTDTLFAAVVTNLRLLTGKADLGAELQLRYHPLDNIELYGPIFGETVIFNAEKSALTFSQESLELSIKSSNPQAQAIFQRECDRILAVDGNSGSVSERIKQILISARLKFPSAAEMAREMYMSESTLQRRLSNEGSSYQTLLDQVRYRLALEYLNGTQLPVSEVAELLGYSSAANFRRSFKRWSGMTPREIRSA